MINYMETYVISNGPECVAVSYNEDTIGVAFITTRPGAWHVDELSFSYNQGAEDGCTLADREEI